MADLPLTFIRGPYDPLLIDHAEGAWLYTADGGKFSTRRPARS